MRALAVTVAFFVGAALGSFAELVAWRVPRGESIVRPRSRCPGCAATLAWYDDVPVVSWFVLRGRCRRCGWRIPARHVAVEVAVGALAAVAAALWLA